MEATGIVRSRETISQTGVARAGEARHSESKCSGSTYQLVDGMRDTLPSPLGALSGASAAFIDVQKYRRSEVPTFSSTDVQQSGKQPSVTRSKV